MLVSPRQAPIVALAGAEQGKAAPALPGLTRLRYESCLSLEKSRSWHHRPVHCTCPAPQNFRSPSPIHSQFIVEQRMANSTERLRMQSGMAFESTSANSALSTPVKSSQRIPGTCSVYRTPQLSKRSAKPFQCAMNCCSIPTNPARSNTRPLSTSLATFTAATLAVQIKNAGLIDASWIGKWRSVRRNLSRTLCVPGWESRPPLRNILLTTLVRAARCP